MQRTALCFCLIIPSHRAVTIRQCHNLDPFLSGVPTVYVNSSSDLLFKELSGKEFPRREVLVLPCSRTASPAVGLSLAGSHIQIFISSPRDSLCHVAQDGIVSCANKTPLVCQKGRIQGFCTAKPFEHSLHYFTATNFACQAWKTYQEAPAFRNKLFCYYI